MADQNYKVSYVIDVEASKAAQELGAFTRSVEALSKFKGDMSESVANVNKAMMAIDKAFKTDKDGKKRSYNYKFNIDTKGSETKLNRVLSTIEKIEAKSKGIKLVVNPGKAFNSKGVKANADEITKHSRSILNNVSNSTLQSQTSITRSIGKINSALHHLERGRELNIKTDTAKGRLNEILGLLRRIRTETGRATNLSVAGGKVMNATRAPYAARPYRTYMLPEKAQAKLNERLAVNQALQQQRFIHNRQNANARLQAQNESMAARTNHNNLVRASREQEAAQQKAVRDNAKELQNKNVQAVRNLMRTQNMSESAYVSQRKAAINRLQYSRPPSLRRALPFAYMLNGYMLYSTMKKQVSNAAEYANIMESARSILKVADSNLGTFESRFSAMAQNVRKVGVETKFTAVEVAGAVKYLAMAGQNIDTINKSIRPITNLALIGDNDLAQISDLVTNIMAGFDIDPDSMPIVADVMASTISRSNVNIVETAEAFKMSAGYLRMAGIDFTEASAAIGMLGNMGVKGTMAGTSLRALATRFAYQPKEAREILDKLGVKFTHHVDIFGEKLEKIRPLADIFEDLNKAGATLGDMHKIFGRIGGNAGMMLLQNYDKLRVDTIHNRTSYGISDSLAKVKQETTKGLWYQMTSTFSETFMGAYEVLEPQIQKILRQFIKNFNTDKFAQGLASLGSALLDIFTLLGKIASWFINNYRWLEPILFTGFAATRLFKLAGAVTNLGVALGFLGKKSAALSGAQLLGALAGGKGVMGALSFGNKRSLVTALRAAGVTGGKGAMTAALTGAGVGRGLRGAATGLFASSVMTGKGLAGAGASLAALGKGAAAAVGGIASLVAALGYAAYKTWKLKEVKDAVLEDLTRQEVYVYPSLDALHSRLKDVYDAAISANDAVSDVTRDGKLKDVTGHSSGWFTKNWWKGLGGTLAWGLGTWGRDDIDKYYTSGHANHDDIKESVEILARFDGLQTHAALYGELGLLKTPEDVDAFINLIPKKYGMDTGKIKKDLYSVYSETGHIRLFKTGLQNMTVDDATKTVEYRLYNNQVTVPQLAEIATGYRDIISSADNALNHIYTTDITAKELNALGLFRNEDGIWNMNPLPDGASEKEKAEYLTNQRSIRYLLGTTVKSLRETWGQDGRIADNIMEKAGFSPYLYSNEPERKALDPWNDPGISVTGLDDDGAGGNYSGTGKLSSAAPKQVIVTIGNLLSIETIDLMKSPEGQTSEIQNLKEQMAQALIDVVHDFDASWNE